MKISLTLDELSEAAAFAIDFVNSYDPMRDPVDLLTHPEEVARFLGGQLAEGETAEEIGAALVTHRDQLRAAFRAAAEGERVPGAQQAHLAGIPEVTWTLSLSEDGVPILQIDRSIPVVRRLEAWSMLGFLALLKHVPDRIRVCQSAPCEEIFQDQTKAGRQKFCSKRCNTRFNVAQHRLRERGKPAE